MLDKLSAHFYVSLVFFIFSSSLIRAAPLYRHTYAVIIGIDHYEDVNIARLDYAVRDAKKVKEVLRERYHFSDIIYLENEEAKLKDIGGTLFSLGNRTTDEDAVFIFLSGHGGYVSAEEKNEGYFLPYDGRKDDPNLGFSISNLRILLENIKAKHIFLVINICSSGLWLETEKAEVVRGDQESVPLSGNDFMEQRSNQKLPFCHLRVQCDFRKKFIV